MDTKRVGWQAVSPGAQEKCIKRARKEVEFLDRWGRWFATVYLVLGLACFGVGVVFVVLLQRIAQGFGIPQQAQNLAWQGFMLGMIFGVITGFMLFKGMFYIGEGIGYLQGKPASRTLVKYHDALANLMHNQDSHLGSESEMSMSHDSLSVNESDV